MATKEDLLRAIHTNCMECVGGSRKLVKGCGIKACPLWPYRTSERARTCEEIEGQMSVWQFVGQEASAR